MYLAFGEKTRLEKVFFVLLPYIGFFFLEAMYTLLIGDPKNVLFFSAAVFGGMAVALGAVVRLGTTRFAKCAFYMLLLAIVLSVITAVLLPHVGVHSGLDKSGGAGRAGEWRGAYLHKNHLGHLSGITAGTLLCLGRRYFSMPVLVTALLLTLLCMIMSHSSSAIVLCVIIPAVYYSVVLPKGWLRVASILLSVLVITVILPFRDEIIGFALGLVGKSADLSGRTTIWRVAEEVMSERPLFGGGLGYTTSTGFHEHLVALFGVNNVHNAYLDAIINYGGIGAFFLLGIIVVIFLQAWMVRLSPERERSRLLLTVLLAGWAVSGLSEVMATRAYGVVAQIGVTALVGLAGIAVSGRENQRSGVSRPVRTAPVRRPPTRTAAAASGKPAGAG